MHPLLLPSFGSVLLQNPAASPFDGSAVPASLLRPLEVLFGPASACGENFLAGLHAARVLGMHVSLTQGLPHLPLAWVGVELANSPGSLFRDLRGGCWVRGFPAVGRGRDLLRAGGLDKAASLAAVLHDFGWVAAVGAILYFNFHYDGPTAGCERVYLLDADQRCLHAFALPPGSAGRRLRACA